MMVDKVVGCIRADAFDGRRTRRGGDARRRLVAEWRSSGSTEGGKLIGRGVVTTSCDEGIPWSWRWCIGRTAMVVLVLMVLVLVKPRWSIMLDIRAVRLRCTVNEVDSSRLAMLWVTTSTEGQVMHVAVHDRVASNARTRRCRRRSDTRQCRRRTRRQVTTRSGRLAGILTSSVSPSIIKLMMMVMVMRCKCAHRRIDIGCECSMMMMVHAVVSCERLDIDSLWEITCRSSAIVVMMRGWRVVPVCTAVTISNQWSSIVARHTTRRDRR